MARISAQSPTTDPAMTHDAVSSEIADLEASVQPVAAHALTPSEQEQRDERFEVGVRTLRVGSASIVLSERILLIAAGVVAPLGLLLVLLGYVGASRTPYLFEQVSYLISGGLFGLALVFLGSFFYFAHWLTQLVKEHREQSSALLAALQSLEQGLAPPSSNGATAESAEPGSLVATATGSMAHRPDCSVVAGKQGLRAAAADDGLEPCKLCEPYRALG